MSTACRALPVALIVLVTFACASADEAASRPSGTPDKPSGRGQRRITDKITEGDAVPRIEVTDEQGKKIVIDEEMG